MKYLELLSPAKNCEQGKAAINHGADALYIGAPSFGARVAAGNSIQDIEELTQYAHLFGSKVFVTVNTLLFDNELQQAQQMIHQLYNIGVDALIIQDLGLLELDLPPIELHASTQTHNIDPRRVKFLQDVGFQRVILARETSIEQIKTIRNTTQVDLEAFVQGALCVSYSGQCYMSQYLNEHSGNRGCCGQPCRSSYDLYNEDFQLLRRNEHLLSLKDFSAAQHIGSMIDAGITSFKIEGRLKDISYVKNITAYYRQLLDNFMEHRNDLSASSQGKCTFFFTPDPTRTFNRGFTDYFLHDRKPMASHATQKSLGKYIGKVIKIDKNSLTISTKEPFTSGDGLCFFGTNNELEGFFVNRVMGNTIFPNRMPDSLKTGIDIWRNNDFAFEKQLQGKSAERKIEVDIILSESTNGAFQVEMKDNFGCSGHSQVDNCEKTTANNPEKAEDQIKKQLSKLGDTAFIARTITNECTQTYFIPASVLNELRRQAADNLKEMRLNHFLPSHPEYSINDPEETHWHFKKNNTPYFTNTLDYKANVINKKSEAFYQRHGATVTEKGLELTKDYRNKALMTTKYCLRYELGQCLLHKNNDTISPAFASNLYLRNNKNLFLLQFDCKECQMKVQLSDRPLPNFKENKTRR